MLSYSSSFSGFSSNRIAESLAFYRDVLGIDVEESMGGFYLLLGGGGRVFIYPKETHEPASFTVLNFVVDDVGLAVDALNSQGVTTRIYDDPDLPTDERGIMRGDERGPEIAWFRDPAGNVLAVLSASQDVD